MTKFKDVPIGGRIKKYGKTWVVIKNYGNGLIVEYTGEIKNHSWHCCFVDIDEGITLETKVNFIG